MRRLHAWLVLVLLAPTAVALEGVRAPPASAITEPSAESTWDVGKEGASCEDARSGIRARTSVRPILAADRVAEYVCVRAGDQLDALPVPAPVSFFSSGAAAASKEEADVEGELRATVADVELGASVGDDAAASADALTADASTRGDAAAAPVERMLPALVAPPNGIPIPPSSGPERSDPPASAPPSREPAPRAEAPALVTERAGGAGEVARVVAASFALSVAAALLYQRLAPHEALRHDGRRRVFEAVRAADAGATAPDVARALSMPRKTAEYHLVYLTRAGMLREHARAGDARRWTTAAARPAPTPDELLVGLVRENPGVSTARLAELARMTRTRVDRRAKELVLRGAIHARAVEGERRFFFG